MHTGQRSLERKARARKDQAEKRPQGSASASSLQRSSLNKQQYLNTERPAHNMRGVHREAISAVLESRGYEAARFLRLCRLCVLGGVEVIQQARVNAVAVRFTAVYLNAGTQRGNSHEQPHERAQNHGNVAHAG